MLLIALLSGETETGNVIPGLVVAVLGVIANTIFFFRYRKLSRMEHDAVLAVQSRLYGAKSLVDMRDRRAADGGPVAHVAGSGVSG